MYANKKLQYANNFATQTTGKYLNESATAAVPNSNSNKSQVELTVGPQYLNAKPQSNSVGKALSIKLRSSYTELIKS